MTDSFRTIIPNIKSGFTLNHKDEILFLGSCFSENIGEKLNYHQYKTNINPLGIMYNPYSVFQFLTYALEKRNYTEEELVYSDNYYYHFDYHTSISSTNSSKLINKINLEIEQTHNSLKKAKTIFITFGSAWFYTKDEKLVGNCHKMPSSNFTKKLASIKNIVNQFSEINNELIKLNKNIKVVFTVSPVRHIKDGIVENKRSKSILIEAIHQIIDIFPNTIYFPSYEIMMDDLRDYRFYKEDMLHPSSKAINYIWGFFSETFFINETKKLNKEINHLKKALNHKPLRPKSEANRVFQNNLKSKVIQFNKDNPSVDPIIYD